MSIYNDDIRGGVWTSLDDDTRLGCRVEHDGSYAVVNFFGSFEVSLGMTETTLVRCRDLFTKALQDMRTDEGERSWLHRAAPTSTNDG